MKVASRWQFRYVGESPSSLSQYTLLAITVTFWCKCVSRSVPLINGFILTTNNPSGSCRHSRILWTNPSKCKRVKLYYEMEVKAVIAFEKSKHPQEALEKSVMSSKQNRSNYLLRDVNLCQFAFIFITFRWFLQCIRHGLLSTIYDKGVGAIMESNIIT